MQGPAGNVGEGLAMNTTQTAEAILGTSIQSALMTLDALAFALHRARTQVTMASQEPLHEKLGRVVCDKFGVSREELFGYMRPAHVARARHCLYALMVRTGLSASETGRLLGRDHGTVLHGVKSWRNYIETDKSMRARWEAILALIEPKEEK